MMRTLALGAAWLMGCGLAIIVGGPWWQRLLIIAVVFMAHLGGRWTECLRPRASAVFADRATQILNAASNTTREATQTTGRQRYPLRRFIRVRANALRHLRTFEPGRVRVHPPAPATQTNDCA